MPTDSDNNKHSILKSLEGLRDLLTAITGLVAKKWELDFLSVGST